MFDKLAEWTALDDRALDDSIFAMTNERPQPERRARARRLFAQALDTPGGLKVQTIHAFCTRLLQQFPFEANVPARFAVLDQAANRNCSISLPSTATVGAVCVGLDELSDSEAIRGFCGRDSTVFAHKLVGQLAHQSGNIVDVL